MEFFNKRTNITYYFLAFSVLLFLIGSLIKLNTPSAEWDYLYIDTAQNWAKGINKTPHFEHPPLYPLFLAILFKFFESSIVIARLGNTFCAFLTAFILFRLTSKLFSRDSALWTIIFYFLGPICIQGISIMDVADTSILPLAFVFTANATVNNTLRPGLRNTIILGLGIGFCLWVKVTSSLALIVGLLAGNLAYLIFERKTKYYKIWLLNITSMFIGLIFFLLTWVCISLFLWGSDACLAVLRSPWIAFYSKLENLNYFSKLIYVGYYTFGISIWFSPYFLIICLNSSWSLVKNTQRSDSVQDNIKFLFIGVIIFYFIGHLVIGGTNYGFPRYHAAIFPLICLLVGVQVSKFTTELNNRTFILLNLNLLFLILFFAFFSNDPLFFLNFRIKEMLLSNYDYETIIKHFLIIFVPLYGLPIIFGILTISFLNINHRGDAIKICLFLGCLATIVSLDIQQILAPYRTSNQYGAKGKIELIQKVRNHIRNHDYVFATPEFIYELSDKGVPSIGFGEWESNERSYQFITEKQPSAIIDGLTVSTYEHLKWLLHKDTQAFLCKYYTFERIGTYFLWLRKIKTNHH